MTKWYNVSGPENDVVVHTRISLARSLPDYPYPQRMNAAGRLETEKKICSAALDENSVLPYHFSYLRLQELEKGDCLSLVERALCSSKFAQERTGGLLFTQDESVAASVNDEDHVRIRVMQTGFLLEQAYELADQLDTFLDRRLHFAFDPQLGFLTHDPANLGTAMHASVLLHLSALQESCAIGRITAGLAKLGLSLEEPSGTEEVIGEEPVLYRLENRVTLGLSEKQALHNLKEIARQLIAQERSARESMREKLEIQDSVSRALGLLESAKMLSCAEMTKLLCRVRFGCAVGLIQKIPLEFIDSLLLELRPENLMVNYGKQMSKNERDALRAELVRERLFRSIQ